MASFSPEEWQTLELNADFMKRVHEVSSAEEADGLVNEGGKIVQGMSDEQHFGRAKLNRSYETAWKTMSEDPDKKN